MNKRLYGMAVPLVTPLNSDGSVCRESVGRLVESVAPSASALLPCLSSGEGTKLSLQQWQEMVAFCVSCARGLPVFPGVLVETRHELLNRAAFAVEAGAAGITVAVPWSASNGIGWTVDYFSGLARELSFPVFLYNQESDLPVEAIIEALSTICHMDQVVAIKESSRRPEVATALAGQRVPAAVFQGWEDLCYQSQGADGNALALANLEPRLCADMFSAPTQDKQATMIALCHKYQLFADDWYVGLKTELWKRGILTTNLSAALAA